MLSDADWAVIRKAAGKKGTPLDTVKAWRKRRIPAERVPELEADTGIPRSRMRPDLWPPDGAKRDAKSEAA